MDLTNLKKLIYDSGLTLDGISKASGVGKSTIQKYLYRGSTNPPMDIMIHFADLFAVPLDYICGRCTLEECNAIEESFADNFRLLRKETYESTALKFRPSTPTAKGYYAPYPYNLLDDIFKEPFDHVVTEDEMNGLNKAISSLGEREQKMLRLYYEEEKTLAEAGKEFNLTRARSGQIIAKAVRKLRHPSRARQILYGDEGNELRMALLEKESELKQREYKLAMAEKAYLQKQEAERTKDEIKTEESEWAAYDTPPIVRYGCSEAFGDLDLSVRSQNCLLRYGANTVEKIIKLIKTPDEHHFHDSSLLYVRNLGRKSYDEIIGKVEKLTGIDFHSYYLGVNIFDGKGNLVKGET